MLRRSALTVSAIVAGALVLSACTSSTSPDPSASGSVDADASVGIRLALPPGNLDVRQTGGVTLDQILIDNVYEGLVSRTPEGEIVPNLATDFEVSADGLTYTFTLTEGVTFHDGQELTPADVVWSLQTRKDTAEFSDSERLAGVTDITAEGQVITLTLGTPDTSLLWNLTGRAGLIFKKDDKVDYKIAANGTGPFSLGVWKQGDSVTLLRNEDYWGEKAKVAEVAFVIIGDNQAAMNAAAAGEIDIITGFDANMTANIEESGDFSVQVGSATDKSVLAMNPTAGKLADKRVRQAIRMAIDHDSIIAAQASGQTLFGPIPQPDPGYEDLSSVISHDVAGAKALLAEAGAENLELTLTIPSEYGTTLPQILVSDLAEAGINLTVEPVDFGTWITDVYSNKDYELSVVNHAEPRDFENWANPEYYFLYDNPEVQRLYAESLAQTDQAASDALLAEAARLVSEDHAADWLYNWSSVVAVATNVTGVPSDNVNSRLDLAELAKTE